MNIKKATLVLKTSDLLSVSNKNVPDNALTPAIYSSQYGSFNKQLSSFTWNNINLRVLLGDMYDMYDEFNLCLNQMSTSALGPDTLIDNRSCYIKMAGLPWINQSYNFKSGNNGTMATIGTFTFGLSGSNTRSQFFNDSFLTFGKSQEQCNLTLEYYRIVDDLLALMPIPSLANLTISGSVGTNTITVSGGATLATSYIGMIITATGIPSNTIILNIVGAVPNYTVTISNTLQMTLSGVTGGAMYSNFPNVIFMFDIYGIPKNDDNKNGDRLPLKSFIPAI